MGDRYATIYTNKPFRIRHAALFLPGMKTRPRSSARRGKILAVLLGFLPLIAACAADWARLSPFTKVKCEGSSAVVQYQDREYELLSINDLAIAELLDLCRKAYRDNWDRRFAEDLVEVLELARRPMTKDQTVKLVLKDRTAGQIATIERALMTGKNRDAVHRSRLTPAGDAASSEDFPAALNRFDKALREQWAYYKASKVDFDAAIRGLREKLRSQPMDSNAFALELQKLIAFGIDGHSGVDGYRLPDGFLPFLIEPSGNRFVGFFEDRTRHLDPQYPFVSALDGKAIGEWLKAAAVLVPKGSPQYVRRNSLRTLRNVQFVRKELGLPASDELRVELEAANGTAKREIRLEIADKMPVFGTWPSGGSKMLPSNIGYLRIASMDEKAVEEIRVWMPRFREAKALVIDVRGNGGGSRDALQYLYSYLTAPTDPPRVANAAVHRLAPAFKEDHLQSRFLYPESAPIWKPAEREAIGAFKKTFRPQWQPPAGEFSDWHYLVLSRLNDDTVFHYGRPAAILMDEKCFSATDIFLAGLKGLPKVRLIGTASGGGSARAMKVGLTPSISVTLGSMVSFQADGTLFDGRGVVPDVVVESQPQYFVGGKDDVLESALATLSR
jgi:hypothetical protein